MIDGLGLESELVKSSTRVVISIVAFNLDNLMYNLHS